MPFDAVTQACASHLKDLDKPRYIACLFAQPADQAPLIALHAFHSELSRIRDSVSEPMLGEIRLTWWREALDGIVAGQPRRHPVVEALAGPIQDKRLDVTQLNAMIDAREGDLYDDAPVDMAAAQDYIRAIGGSLYAQVIAVTGGDEATQEQGRALGAAAAQLAVVEAVGYHAQRREVHLAVDALEAAGQAPEMLFQGAFTPGLKSTLGKMGTQSLSTLQESLSLPWSKRQRAGLAPAILALISGRGAAKHDFDPEQPSPPVNIARFIVRAWIYSRFGRL
ncbi:MAG: squalene/phytoene synthase family protein [Pseudomonadota bacterium]